MATSEESGREHAARVSVEPLIDRHGIRVDDRIERRRCELVTGDSVAPTPIDTDGFRYPVDVAVRLSTAELTVAPLGATYVHGGGEVTEVPVFEVHRFDAGTYSIELTGPLKLYLDVEAGFEVENGVTKSEIRFDGETTVRVGARSLHERPAATVTTTDDPVDLMSAVSTFGSALKTTTSERSYPTLRGHPPALELGEALSIPGGLEPPTSAVHIEVPATLESVFLVSPLAYYLGAPVREGDVPRLVVDGTAYTPEQCDDDVETAVERVLKQTFFLDCLVRTAGPRRIPLWERRALAPDLDVDLEELYGRPAADRLRAYMEVPYDRIEPYVPTWKLFAHVQPSGSNVEALPFLASDLAVLRCSDGTEPPAAGVTSSRRIGATDGGATDGGDADGGSAEVGRSTVPSPETSTPGSAGPTAGMDPKAASSGRTERSTSIEETWVGDGIAPGTSKAMPEAYRNRLGRDPRESDVEIVVVCNDAGMLEEQNVAREVYGSREDLPFDVTLYEGLTTDRLELVLESDVDYLHYIGHVTESGFECTDGVLDASGLDRVDVDVAFLNACCSYEQGVELIRKGAVAGVVTLDDVIDSGAVRIGETMARLLNVGFPLRSALTIARDRSIVGSQYLVVGDGNADISQARGYVPVLAEATSTDEGDYRLSITTYPTRWAGMGTQFRPTIRDCEEVYLSPGPLPEHRLSAEALDEYLSTGCFPVILDGEFTWSDEIEPL